MSMWYLAASAGMAVLGNIQETNRTNSSALQAAGMRDASLDIQAEIQRESLGMPAAEIQRVEQSNLIRSQQATMAASAQKQVQAAAAGVSGQSVDLGMTESAAQSARLDKEIRDDAKRQMRLIDQEYRNAGISTEASKVPIDLAERQKGLGLAHMISGAGRYGFLTGEGLFKS